jgi:hypothetical protein
MIAVFASLCLTVLGLFLGGVMKSRGFSTALSVGFILLLASLNYAWFWSVEEILKVPAFDEPEVRLTFWMFLIHPSAFALLLLIASATQISFRADNQSTPLRLAMMIQQALFIGSIAMVAMLEYFPKEAVGVCTIVAAHYWLIMGFLMVGEVPHMSRRIQRTLPTSWLGRTFLSLLMPGPGRGYLFAVAMLWSCGLSFALLAQFIDSMLANFGTRLGFSLRIGVVTGWNSVVEIYHLVFLACYYPTLYLSIAYLLAHARLHRRVVREGGMGPGIMLFVGCLLVAVSMIVASLVQSQFGNRPMVSDDSFASFCNWYWMFGELLRSGRTLNQLWLFAFVLPTSAFVLIAMLVASRELTLTAVAVPERVLEDSQPLEPKLPVGESIDEIFGKLAEPKVEN